MGIVLITSISAIIYKQTPDLAAIIGMLLILFSSGLMAMNIKLAVCPLQSSHVEMSV